MAGSKPRKAASKPSHLASMTLQAKPAEKTRLVMSERKRSSEIVSGALGLGFFGSSFCKAFAPPLRFSARARMILKAVLRDLVGAFFGGCVFATGVNPVSRAAPPSTGRARRGFRPQYAR